LPIAADVPTTDEAGWPGLTVSSWQGIWAPRGTSKAVIGRINAAVVTTLRDPSIRQRLIGLAQEIPPPAQQTPAALGNLQTAEIAKWWPIIRKAGMKAQ
jgi:tripartite-type tricarboxylate transporter receptor subunit TctC